MYSTFECLFKPNHKKQSDMVDPVYTREVSLSNVRSTPLIVFVLSLTIIGYTLPDILHRTPNSQKNVFNVLTLF